jgi:hypothetical protein
MVMEVWVSLDLDVRFSLDAIPFFRLQYYYDTGSGQVGVMTRLRERDNMT